MSATAAAHALRTMSIINQEEIAAPIEIVFESLLEHLGPENQTGPTSPLPMVLEPWPGGRWYRDLGRCAGCEAAGHFWGHVQVIKPPTLLEIWGPLCMSYPAVNHVQFRLTVRGKQTNLALAHRAFGEITDEHRDTMPGGWLHELSRIRDSAERRFGECGGR